MKYVRVYADDQGESHFEAVFRRGSAEQCAEKQREERHEECGRMTAAFDDPLREFEARV
ncbi:MAG: hypothetical protein M3176_15375 [Chloroflexota bacterium]|nr:hypothetical protein [Chloroflexota bacterium]